MFTSIEEIIHGRFFKEIFFEISLFIENHLIIVYYKLQFFKLQIIILRNNLKKNYYKCH